MTCMPGPLRILWVSAGACLPSGIWKSKVTMDFFVSYQLVQAHVNSFNDVEAKRSYYPHTHKVICAVERLQGLTGEVRSELGECANAHRSQKRSRLEIVPANSDFLASCKPECALVKTF